jgi:hypothetical protein
MDTHELLGFITLAIFGVLAVWRIWRERRMGTTERALALALSLGGAGVLIATAAYGGRLVFDHAAGIPTEVLTSETRERAEEHEHEPATAPMAGDSAAPLAAPAAGDHVDPPRAPPHSHEPEKPAGRTDPPDTLAHER